MQEHIKFTINKEFHTTSVTATIIHLSYKLCPLGSLIKLIRAETGEKQIKNFSELQQIQVLDRTASTRSVKILIQFP